MISPEHIHVEKIKKELSDMGFNCCQNQTSLPRVGCYCDYCLILRHPEILNDNNDRVVSDT